MLINEPELPLVAKSAAETPLAKQALNDYYLCRLSRELSNFIRRDVLTGRAKFGVSDDGKELYQVAMARAIEPGDWRADYYRGHTLLLALGLATPANIFSQLYSDAEHDKFSSGRQMVGHHATPTINKEDGSWADHLASLNVSSATSPTAGQMARGLGLAFASRVYREGEDLPEGFSNQGNEISWTEIGDASTSEGVFWETLNAAGVLQVPMVTTVVDDGFGISVPVEKQTTKSSISEALAGLQAEKGTNGIDIYNAKGWDYPELIALYPRIASRVRAQHRAALVHITELTQPNGHSTSGSHERYKSKERLNWEKEFDCISQFRYWLKAELNVSDEALDALDKQAKKKVADERRVAWDRFNARLDASRKALLELIPVNGQSVPEYETFRADVSRLDLPVTSELIDATRRLRLATGAKNFPPALRDWLRDAQQDLHDVMGKHLLSESVNSPVRLSATPVEFGDGQKTMPAYEVLQNYFQEKFAATPELYAFGEDVGKIGDVNQGFAGLQAQFGEHRVFDTGIREWSIIGQAMGMAMRGLRPIAEIQYLDYIFYALPMLTDDVATLRWRTAGRQSAPLIIRTRGHRLEGVWHSGSYLSPMIGSLRGMHLCVPRNAVQAVGMYNTLLAGDDPGIVVEVLNGYRLHEPLPVNLTEFAVPLGVPDCVREGTDLTVVTYGACVTVCLEAAHLLADKGIDVEIIDVQTLLPFDIEHRITSRLQQTNRLLIVDEDAPGGTSAYIRQQILEVQGGYAFLDAAVKTMTAAEHRPAYGDDGNYASKPQVMDVVEKVMELMVF